jgi:hypothetical protein
VLDVKGSFKPLVATAPEVDIHVPVLRNSPGNRPQPHSKYLCADRTERARPRPDRTLKVVFDKRRHAQDQEIATIYVAKRIILPCSNGILSSDRQ